MTIEGVRESCGRNERMRRGRGGRMIKTEEKEGQEDKKKRRRRRGKPMIKMVEKDA